MVRVELRLALGQVRLGLSIAEIQLLVLCISRNTITLSRHAPGVITP